MEVLQEIRRKIGKVKNMHVFEDWKCFRRLQILNNCWVTFYFFCPLWSTMLIRPNVDDIQLKFAFQNWPNLDLRTSTTSKFNRFIVNYLCDRYKNIVCQQGWLSNYSNHICEGAAKSHFKKNLFQWSEICPLSIRIWFLSLTSNTFENFVRGIYSLSQQIHLF